LLRPPPRSPLFPYTTLFRSSYVLTMPTNLSKASGLMWHDVPNRGTPLLIGAQERSFGDIGLASAWQGDNSGINSANGTTVRPVQDRKSTRLNSSHVAISYAV